MHERTRRESKAAQDSEVASQTKKDQQVQQYNLQVAAAKSKYLAAQSANDLAESTVEREAQATRAQAISDAQAAQEQLRHAERLHKAAIKKAAKAVEDVRQHHIGQYAKGVPTSKLKPAKITPTDPNDPNFAKPAEDPPVKVSDADAKPPAPKSVVRAIKEVAIKNGLDVSVNDVVGGKESGAVHDKTNAGQSQ